MTPVVYDAGVLVAADRNVRTAWAEHKVRLEAGVVPGGAGPRLSPRSAARPHKLS